MQETPYRLKWSAYRQRAASEAARVRSWLEEPQNMRRAGLVALPLLVLVGLLLPPVSLATRLTTLDYSHVKPGSSASVPADVPGVYLDIDRVALRRATRARVRSTGTPGVVAALPEGRELLGQVYEIDFRGPVPKYAWLTIPLVVSEDEQPFVDPYGWDGHRWRWLASQRGTPGRLRIRLPLDSFVPEYVAVTMAGEGATELSVVLLPPPARVPAAVAEMPIVEMRAYDLTTDDGTVSGHAFPVGSRDAERYGVISNLEGSRVRSDLVNNLLIRPDSRLRHRQAILDIVRRDRLDGIVLDYRRVARDLQPTFQGFVGRLADDLHGADAELIVMVPTPKQGARDWDSVGYSLQDLGSRADGVRIMLPSGRPMEIEELDSMVRWALGQVERGKLQLALPVQGRDLVAGEQEARPITYGDALARILDMARSDAPGRITPGTSATIELPTIKAAELGRDPATGMWRFYYWDDNRRQHTVWLNDAAGLKAPFEIAARYRLGRLALDGVEAGLDPSLWQMAKGFVESGDLEAPETHYQLLWQLTDGSGRIVQEATQPLDASSFTFRAPKTRGRYRVGVKLMTDDTVAALGPAADVLVAPPPPPTPRPTPRLILIPPSPAPYRTAPPPADELVTRTPVRIEATPEETGTAIAHDAIVTVAEATLRDGPGVRYEAIGTLRLGDRLELLGRSRDNKWLLVRIMSTGVQGWVLSELLELDEVLGPDIPVIETSTPEP